VTSELSPSPHRASFERFLQRDIAPDQRDDVGLQGVLRAQFPLTAAEGLVSLEFVAYAIERPKYDVGECLRRGLTYAAPIKATVRLVIWEGDEDARLIRDVKEQELYFGEVPLLTEGDVFVHGGVERTPLLTLQRRATATGETALHLLAVGDHLAEAAATGLAATLATTQKRMDRAAAMDSVETMMPHDLVHAKPLPRAFLKLLEKSPRVEPIDDTNPLARVAHGWTVVGDDGVRASLAPDTAVPDDGAIDEAAMRGDRSLAARIAADGDALLRALPLAEAAPMRVETSLAKAVAARSGAWVVAARAGTVHHVNDRRVWVLEDGAEAPVGHALVSSDAPRVVTPLSLRPTVAQGARVAAGDGLAEGAAVAGGTLALGRFCAVTYAPERAPGTCRVSANGARALRSLHRERVLVEVRDTKLGCQELMRDVPDAAPHALRHLDASGVATLGAAVEPGDVLVGRVTPTAAGAMSDDAVRAMVRGVVVGVEMFARRGRERCARHEAIVSAMKDDVRAAQEEHLAGFAALGTDEGDARWRYDERLYALDRGDDLPPGVASRACLELLVERDVVSGDTLADGRGGRWVVAEVTDDVASEVELAGEGAGGAVYLMKLRPEATKKPAAKKKRRAR